jgi:hypothetical protein
MRQIKRTRTSKKMTVGKAFGVCTKKRPNLESESQDTRPAHKRAHRQRSDLEAPRAVYSDDVACDLDRGGAALFLLVFLR